MGTQKPSQRCWPRFR